MTVLTTPSTCLPTLVRSPWRECTTSAVRRYSVRCNVSAIWLASLIGVAV
jgi:hypothetical protein